MKTLQYLQRTKFRQQHSPISLLVQHDRYFNLSNVFLRRISIGSSAALNVPRSVLRFKFIHLLTMHLLSQTVRSYTSTGRVLLGLKRPNRNKSTTPIDMPVTRHQRGDAIRLHCGLPSYQKQSGLTTDRR
jgi:hypothetical protein